MFKSVISLLVILPLTAFAKGGDGSEFFYQSAAGKHELTPSLQMNSLEIEYTGGTKLTTDTNQLNLEYEYGLMEELSVGAALGYVFGGDYELLGTKGDISGLSNIEVFAKATMPAGPGFLKYGASLSLSPEDKETESNNDVNASTGGHSLEPYIGYEYAWDNCTFGAKLAVDVGLTDRTEKTSSGSTDYSGGEATTISLFYEHKFSEAMKLGASLDWITKSDLKNETSGGTTEQLSPTQLLSIYLPTSVGSGTLLPELGYGFTTEDKVGATEIDSYSMLNLALGYRMEF